MVVGLGTDVVQIRRIKEAYERLGDKLAQRILSTHEMGDFKNFPASRKVEFLAGRFAAKEAIAKAAGCGLAKLKMRTVSIVLEKHGLSIKWNKIEHEPSYASLRWHVSISHTSDSAFAVAICESV